MHASVLGGAVAGPLPGKGVLVHLVPGGHGGSLWGAGRCNPASGDPHPPLRMWRVHILHHVLAGPGTQTAGISPAARTQGGGRGGRFFLSPNDEPPPCNKHTGPKVPRPRFCETMGLRTAPHQKNFKAFQKEILNNHLRSDPNKGTSPWGPKLRPQK